MSLIFLSRNTSICPLRKSIHNRNQCNSFVLAFFTSNKWTVLLFFLLIIQINKCEMIYAYNFAQSNSNPTYLFNTLEYPPNHPINSIAGPQSCSDSFFNDSAKDAFCVRTSSGLYFPKSQSSDNVLEGFLATTPFQNSYSSYTLLVRIFIDPSNINQDSMNYILFGYAWECKAYFYVGLVIKFFQKHQIKIFIYSLKFDDNINGGQRTDQYELESIVPTISAPSWIYISLNFNYIFNSNIPLCLNEKIYQKGFAYTFPTTLLSMTTLSEDALTDDYIFSVADIIGYKIFGMTIQFIGRFNFRHIWWRNIVCKY